MNRVKQHVLKKRSNVEYSIYAWFLMMLISFAAITTNSAHAQLNGKHPLVGKLWSVEDSRFIDTEELKRKVLESDYVAIGETHDNMDHHRIQAKILNWFVSENKPVSPVFEMLSEQQLGSIQKMPPESSDSFFDKVSWEDSGWPDRKFYKPIFDIVIEQKLPIFAAETERALLMQLTKGGESHLPDDIAKYLNDVKLGEDQKKQLKEEIIDSHCGMLPETMVDPMVLGQRVRDVVMAKSLLSASKTGTAILFSGSGHGRKDYGAPAYVKSQHPDARISTVAMMEVVEEVVQPGDYSEAWASKKIPFDYVWFTSRMERGDPCEELKQHFKKHPV